LIERIVLFILKVKLSSDGGDTLETPQDVIDKWISEVAEFLAQEKEEIGL